VWEVVNDPKCELLWPSNMSTCPNHEQALGKYLGKPLRIWGIGMHAMLEIHLSIWADSSLVHEKRLTTRLRRAAR
jgi:hypothetical protein